MRDIKVDSERSELIRFAFTAYSTGDWSLSTLAKALETRGLTSRPTPARAAKPLSTTTLHKILTNPYYQGTVVFRGVTYEGAHTPLVDQETWLRVQMHLSEKNNVGERPQTYDHYLKGSVYCSCGAKLMIECPRDKQGERYEYFTCSGRRKKNGCTRSAIMIDRIEREVEATFGQNGLSHEEAAQTRAVLRKVFDQLEASTDDERKLLAGQVEKLEAERLKLVQAHYADAIPLDLMKTEQARITANLESIKSRLVGLSSTYKEAREGLDQLADLITDLGDLYRKCEPSARQILVRAVVKKIVIDEDEKISYEPTKSVSTAKTYAAQQNDAGSVTTKDSVIAETGVHLGEVSNFSHRVDLRGTESLEIKASLWGYRTEVVDGTLI